MQWRLDNGSGYASMSGLAVALPGNLYWNGSAWVPAASLTNAEAYTASGPAIIPGVQEQQGGGWSGVYIFTLSAVPPAGTALVVLYLYSGATPVLGAQIGTLAVPISSPTVIPFTSQSKNGISAGSIIPLGPFLSSTPPNPVLTTGTPTVELYYSNGMNQAATGTITSLDSNGMCEYTPSVADTATVGQVKILGILSGALPYFEIDQIVATPSGTVVNAGTGFLGFTYANLQQRLAYEFFGIRPVGSAITLTTDQAIDINAAIQDGLAYVYGAYHWSFLRPRVPITTQASYTTGTIIIDTTGDVIGVGTSFPSYATSYGGQITINSPVPPTFYSGTYSVASYISPTQLTLSGYNGPAYPATIATGSGGATNSAPGTTFTWGTPTTASIGQYVIVYSGTGSVTPGAYLITGVNGTTSVTLATSPGASLSAVSWGLSASGSGIPYILSFNLYPVDSSLNTFEKPLTYTGYQGFPRHSLLQVDEYLIRQKLQGEMTPRRPEWYALVTNNFVPANGSSRSVVFWPIPDQSYNLTGIGVLRPVMLQNATDQPLGIEVMSAAIMESCLAAGERNIDHYDAMSPQAVHNRALPALLAEAIRMDKENSSAESLGIDRGDGEGRGCGSGYDRMVGASIYFDGFADITGWIS
jgi:hypothetical protein